MCRKLVLFATVIAFCLPAPAMAQLLSPEADPPALEAEPQKASPADRAIAERSDPLARATFWSQEVRVDPRDAEAGVALARALRDLGRYDEAFFTAERISLIEPENRAALIEMGKAQIAADQGFYAIDPLRRARDLAPGDWQAYSLLGVAYEQVEREEDAWGAYHQALSLSPENPAVLSNIGMYLAARGRPAEAEPYLRRAAAAPEATVQVRQNLAFVLGVQGKMPEAERILREHLPPDLANNNLAYLRALAGG